MRDQWIKLVFDGASESTDADAFARRFTAIVRLLVSIDKRNYSVHQKRYEWDITAAQKQSPLAMELSGRLIHEDATTFDVVGAVINGLEYIDNAANPEMPDNFAYEDLGLIEKIARRSKGKRGGISLRISVRDNGTVRDYTPSDQLADKVRRLKYQSPQAQDEYVSIEGELFMLEKEREPGKGANRFSLLTRETGEIIQCVFKPEHVGKLGSSWGGDVFVSGVLTRSVMGGQPTLAVDAFHALPKQSISLDEVHRRGLRIPGGQTSEEFVRDMRSESG